MYRFLVLIGLFFFSIDQLRSQDIGLIKSQLEASPVLKNHFFGFSLYDIEQDRFLLGVNEDKYFTPASNTKIFTLFTALKHIGDSIPGIHYIERGDSLLFWGTGDPTFLHPTLDSGNVYRFLQSTTKRLFYVGTVPTEEPFYRMGWAMEDYDEAFQPEISVFPIYGNIVRFKLQSRKLITVPSYFMDTMDVDDGYKRKKPFKYSDELFVRLLEDTLKKPIEYIKYQKPENVDTLFSAATVDVVREMMLMSDNFLAEQLMMVAAMNRYAAFHTAALRKDMEKEHYGFFVDKVYLYDGSGLSPYNKVTARSLVDLLLMIQRDISQADSLRYLFAAGGAEGTLKATYRLDRGIPFVWAKTGTLKNVYCQAGYIQTRSGRNLVFSFLNNNIPGSVSPVRREVARIMTYIREHF